MSLTLEGRAIGSGRYRGRQHPGGPRCRPVMVAMTATDHPGQHPRRLLSRKDGVSRANVRHAAIYSFFVIKYLFPVVVDWERRQLQIILSPDVCRRALSLRQSTARRGGLLRTNNYIQYATRD